MCCKLQVTLELQDQGRPSQIAIIRGCAHQVDHNEEQLIRNLNGCRTNSPAVGRLGNSINPLDTQKQKAVLRAIIPNIDLYNSV